MNGRKRLIDKVRHMDIAVLIHYSGFELHRIDGTHEDLYPANSKSSILTSPLASIVNIRALGTLTLR